MSVRYLFLIVGLLGIGIWSGCRPGAPQERPTSDVQAPLTASAAADIIIVEKGSPRLATVHTVPAQIVLSPGETAALSAIAFDQHGRELRQVTIDWQAVDTRAGTISSRGVFRAGFTQGTFRDVLVVTARAPAGMGSGLVQATASVTVKEFSTQLQPAGIRVFPDKMDVEPRETIQLLALAMDTNGVAVPNMKFNWEMVEPLAGTISRDGRLTAGETVGTYPNAIKVTLAEQIVAGGLIISASPDVRILDPATVSGRISATVLPQVISLRPQEHIRFTTLVLDSQGNPIIPVEPRWEIRDAKAGVISQDGRFTAGVDPDIYREAVTVSMVVPGVDEKVVATGTVIIVQVAPPSSAQPEELLSQVAIFPELVVLSPGESARVSVLGINGDFRSIPSADVSWSINPPEVGEVSRFITVTAHDFPGTYEGAIRAELTVQTDSGPVTKEVSATLIIRGTLARAEIIPKVDTVARGEKVQFRAVAYDKNRALLTDVSFRWDMADPTAGTIDANEVFTAEGLPGEYLGAVSVQAVQKPRF